MGTSTPRLKINKMAYALGASDVVNVAADHNSPFEVIDDHANLRSRSVGVFPPVSERYEGGPLYHAASGRVYATQSDLSFKAVAQTRNYVKKLGKAVFSVPNAADTVVNWDGYTEVRDGLSFESDGGIRFTKAGSYLVGTEMYSGVPENVGERFLTIMVQDGAATQQFRIATAWSVVTVAYLTVTALVQIPPSRIGWKAFVIVYQGSGGAINYGTGQDSFSAVSVGAHNVDN